MSNSGSGFKKFSVDGKGCKEIKVLHNTDLVFEVCMRDNEVLLRHKGKEVLVSFDDFKNQRALASILYEEFDYNLKDPLTKEIASQLQSNVKLGFVHEIRIDKEDRRRDGLYITTEQEGTYTGKNMITPIWIKKIEKVSYAGFVKADFDMDVIVVEIQNGIKLAGELNDIVEVVRAKYGLKQAEDLKILLSKHLLNGEYGKTEGYYAIGVWFDGKTLSFVTESLYNPIWKEVTTYKLPPEIPIEDKVKVLKRIIATVNSYRSRRLIVFILCYGLASNFAHYFRQTIGYFPHLIMMGDKRTGKTSLLLLIQYLFWGNNKLPNIRPKTEFTLRKAISQTTLVTPIEDWEELSNQNTNIDELLNALHISAQVFDFTKMTAPSKEVNGKFLSLSAILADTNKSRDISKESTDKILYIKIDKEEGVDVKMAEELGALLKHELLGNLYLHDVLHSIGIELIQIMAQRLKGIKLEKDRTLAFDKIIYEAYNAWIELFRRYGISLKPTVEEYIYEEFPAPLYQIIETETEDDLYAEFLRYLYQKVKRAMYDLGRLPNDRSDLLKYGFYIHYDEEMKKNVVTVTYDFLKDFRMERKITDKSMRKITEALHAKHSSFSYEDKIKNNTFNITLPDGFL